MKGVAIAIAILGLLIAGFFLWYGIDAGVLRKRILARHPDVYDTGAAAVRRGILYVVLGLLFLSGSALTLAVVYEQLK